MLTVNGPLLTKQAASLPCEKSGQNPAKTGCRRELSGIRLEAKKSSPHGSESLAKRKEIADLNYWKRIFQTKFEGRTCGEGRQTRCIYMEDVQVANNYFSSKNINAFY